MTIERAMWAIWAVIAAVSVAAAQGYWPMVLLVVVVTTLMAKAFGPWPRRRPHSIMEVKHGPAE